VSDKKIIVGHITSFTFCVIKIKRLNYIQLTNQLKHGYNITINEQIGFRDKCNVTGLIKYM